MFCRGTVQYSPILHVVIRMHISNHAHSDHELQLAKIMAEVGSTALVAQECRYMKLWLNEDSKVTKESLNDKERINRMKTR